MQRLSGVKGVAPVAHPGVSAPTPQHPPRNVHLKGTEAGRSQAPGLPCLLQGKQGFLHVPPEREEQAPRRPWAGRAQRAPSEVVRNVVQI